MGRRRENGEEEEEGEWGGIRVTGKELHKSWLILLIVFITKPSSKNRF